MLDHLKRTLREIREERIEELASYKKIIQDFPDSERRYEKRRAILVLELPFKTDAASLNSAKVGLFGSRRNQRNQKVAKPIKTIFIEWLRSGAEHTQMLRQSFLDKLESEGFFTFFYETADGKKPMPIEDFPNRSPMETMLDFVGRMNVSKSTKATYSSYVKSFYEFVVSDLHPSSGEFSQFGESLSLFEAEKLFEYLEKRALRSSTTRVFLDILICRSLFYLRLSAKELFSLPNPNADTRTVHLDGQDWVIPSSFIRLWQHFSLAEYLFPKALNERTLYQKIHRLGGYAKVSTVLTPTILKSSLRAICQQDLRIGPKAISMLPRR